MQKFAAAWCTRCRWGAREILSTWRDRSGAPACWRCAPSIIQVYPQRRRHITVCKPRHRAVQRCGSSEPIVYDVLPSTARLSAADAVMPAVVPSAADGAAAISSGLAAGTAAPAAKLRSRTGGAGGGPKDRRPAL